MNKITKILFISFFAVLLVTGCGKKEQVEEKNEENKVEENKTTNQINLDDEQFTFEKKSLEYKDGVTKLKVEVTNKSGEDINLRTIVVSFKDETGKDIVVLKKNLSGKLPANSKKKIEIVVKKDVTKAAKIEYEIIGY